jgi:hypothetical protein
MVRVVDSQWLEPVTFGSPLVNVTCHDVLVLALTLNVVLPVVSAAELLVPEASSRTADR